MLILLIARLWSAAKRKYENTAKVQAINYFSNDILLFGEWNVPNAIPCSDEIIFIRQFVFADVLMMEVNVWVAIFC